jgi:hypothetical protein
MNAYIYTTDTPNICLVAVGEDENEAKVVAEQAVSVRPGAKLQGFQPINHSVVFSWDVTILTKAKSDDILIRKILEYFGQEASIELRNDPQPDGTVTKHFFVEGINRLDLHLKNPQQIADYEKKGLDDPYVQELIKGLKPHVKRGIKPELSPVLSPAAEITNGETPP